MLRPWVLSCALGLVACGSGASSTTPGACGPCQGQGSNGTQGVGLPRSAKLQELGRKRVELARKRLVDLRASFERGGVTVDELFAACRDVAFAARDSGFHGEALRDVLKEYRDAVVALKDLTRERVAKGTVGQDAITRVDAIAAEAEYWLEEAGQAL